MDSKISVFFQNLKQKAQNFWALLNQDLKTLWVNNRIFLIICSALILVIKFRSILISILLKDSKDLLDNAKATDAQLKKQETDANAKANDLIAQANELPKSEQPVDENWNKK